MSEDVDSVKPGRSWSRSQIPGVLRASLFAAVDGFAIYRKRFHAPEAEGIRINWFSGLVLRCLEDASPQGFAKFSFQVMDCIFFGEVRHSQLRPNSN
jgi:hypothetical protein